MKCVLGNKKEEKNTELEGVSTLLTGTVHLSNLFMLRLIHRGGLLKPEYFSE